MMIKIEKVGNLTIFAEHCNLFEEDTTLHAYNGADEVFAETYIGHWTMANGLRSCINDFMLKMNYLTEEMVGHYCPTVHKEYNGKLLVGEIAEGVTAYFKKVDDSIYYKYFDHRPMM